MLLALNISFTNFSFSVPLDLKSEMLFNTSDIWPQHNSSTQEQPKQETRQHQKQSTPRHVIPPHPIQNMSPNELYGALLQYHLHQQQMVNSQDIFMQQQQQRQESLLMTDDGKSLQHFQMIQRAAQLAAAHQIIGKNDLNSPASSTSSSHPTESLTSPFNPLDDLMHIEEIRKGQQQQQQRKDDILKNIITNSDANKSSSKRPLLKFSMDSILGNGERSSKKLCRGLQSPSEVSQLENSKQPRAHKSPKSVPSDQNPYRIQLNYNFMNHPQISSQRPSPQESNSTDPIEHQAKLSQIQQQQNLAIAAAKSQHGQFPMSKLKFLLFSRWCLM